MISEPTLYRETDTGIVMSSSRDPAKEGFIDRHQLWPFYRRRRYCDETLEAVREVWREMDEGYTVDDYPDAIVSCNAHKRANTKYRLVEKPRCLKGRARMADRGYDLDDLDYIIDMLCRGDPLPPRYKNRKRKGDMKGYMECHIGFDWVLVYRYDGDDLILYTVDTGTHKDVFGNRSQLWSSEQSR